MFNITGAWKDKVNVIFFYYQECLVRMNLRIDYFLPYCWKVGFLTIKNLIFFKMKNQGVEIIVNILARK